MNACHTTGLVVAGCLLALFALGCGGRGDHLTRGYSARCTDGELDFADSCGGLCFGHGSVSEYYQRCR